MDFIPHTTNETRAMLQTIGLNSLDELFAMIPNELQNPPIPLPPALTEMEIIEAMEDTAAKNTGSEMLSFLGGGAYKHFVPKAVAALLSRGDFYTAYTPYQAEASQGTLQAIYEFQTYMSRLTGLEIANASMYDGASALAEAALMACRVTRKETVYVSQAVNPRYREVMKTYLRGPGITLVEIPLRDGLTDTDWLRQQALDQAAVVFAQHPNYFGLIEPLAEIRAVTQAVGVPLGLSVYPLSLGCLRKPASYGAEIVVGDLQSLGLSLNYGGPYAGFIATTQRFLRQLPGRLVGRTKDADGNPAYTLTLQTREQHIRREKATSNICTNQGLCALAATIYLALMGPNGFRRAAECSVRRAHRLQELLCSLQGVRLVFSQPFFNEFVLALPMPVSSFIDEAHSQGILPGIRLAPGVAGESESLLVCATETTSPAAIERYGDVLRGALAR